MASITIRRLDESVKGRLRVRAAQHGRSMEEEVREILKAAVSGEAGPGDLVDSIRARFAVLGGVEIPQAPREPIRRRPPIGE